MTAITYAAMEWGVTAFACCPGPNGRGLTFIFYMEERWEPLLCPFHAISHDSPGDFKSPFCVCHHHSLLLDLALLAYFYQLSPPTCSLQFMGGEIHSDSQSPVEFTDSWPRVSLLDHVHTVTNGSGNVCKFWELFMESSWCAPFGLSAHIPSCCSKHRCGWWVCQQVDGRVQEVIWLI